MALEFASGFIVYPLLQEFIDRIKASAADAIGLAFSFDLEKELKSLEAGYVKVQSMLDNIDGWDLITSKLHQDWVADVRRACYATEDFFEDLKLQISINEDAGFLRTYWRNWGVPSKIHDLQSNLNHLANVSCQFTTSSHILSHIKHLVSSTHRYLKPDDRRFRRMQEKQNIVQELLGSTRSSSSSSRIVLITGMFGLGKTLLAQAVRSDSRIEDHYDQFLWISVSGEFNLGKALCSMTPALKLEGNHELESVRSLSAGLQCGMMFQSLRKEKKVLIVLDDVCSFVNPQDWEHFQAVMLYSSSIFGIIITTRNPKVATVVASVSSVPTFSLYLRRMSDEDCALIAETLISPAYSKCFKRKRCGRIASKVDSQQIAERYCKGLPLVANIIACNYSGLVDLPQDLWEIPEFKSLIFPRFRLNYAHLSIFLKNSFPYFSLFPDGYVFKRDELIRLWLAEGYVKSQVAGIQQSKISDLEQRGDCYFDEVLSQSILQVYPLLDKEPDTYQMHEFIHRYARCIGSDLYIQLDEHFVDACSSCNASGKLAKLRNARHLSLLHPSMPWGIWKDLERHSEELRTILSLKEHICIGQVSYTLFSKLRSLRVLNLSGTDLSDLPESVGKLEQLRLLDVSRTAIQELPEATADLSELLFLKVDQCALLQLPKRTKDLTRLLHLEADIKSLTSMPPGIGNLTNLRTLSAFIVDNEDEYRVTELKNMKYIQGSICLTNLENVKDEVEAKGAMLSRKPFLERLELEWNGYLEDQSVSERILSGFEPHENLQELQVTGYGGAQFPCWLCSPECCLTSIYLLRCDRCSVLPELWQLQHLKALTIEEMHSVECIDDRFSGMGVVAGFPSLELLRLQDMVSLKKWSGLQANQMPCLRDLVITDCPKLESLPSLNLLHSLVNLEITCCPLLKALPEDGLPSSLEALIIVKCLLLKERCSQQGADWEKIQEVPNVVIDFEHISRSG